MIPSKLCFSTRLAVPYRKYSSVSNHVFSLMEVLSDSTPLCTLTRRNRLGRRPKRKSSRNTAKKQSRGNPKHDFLVRKPPQVCTTHTTVWAPSHLTSSAIKWILSYKSWCPRTTSTTVPIIAAEKSELHPSPFRRNTPNSIAYNGHSYISRRRSLTGHFQENNGALEQRVIQYRCTTVQLILQRNQNFLCHRCSSILAKMQYIVLDAR